MAEVSAGLRHFTDAERRVRLAQRHGLGPGADLRSPEEVTAALVALHATEPATVHLTVQARAPHLAVADVERALYHDRSLVKQLAMRRTLWTFPRDLLPAVWGSAAARTAGSERRRLVKDLERAGVADGEAWLAEVAGSIRARLHDGDEVAARTLRDEVPQLGQVITFGAGRWSQDAPVGPRVLTLLGAEGHLVRAHNDGHWRIGRHAWTATAAWLEEEAPRPWPESEGYAELVRRWLASFGPGTEDDMVWWLGGTKSVVRAALADVEAVPIMLDGGGTGWLLPDDPLLDQTQGATDPGHWVALLPVLDPTVMGWKGREWYLGPHRDALFDRNGNAGTTAWVDGRVVGCWVQRADSAVEVHLLEDVERPARRALDAEAARLTAWLDGQLVSTVYPSSAMKEARDGA